MADDTKAGEDLLPEGFHELAGLVGDWVLDTREARRDKREASSIEDIKAYYQIVSPKFKGIAGHLDKFPLNTLPEPEERLFKLAMMFVEVAMAVEFHGQPSVPGGFPSHRWIIAR